MAAPPLQGRVALITGAGRGQGRAHALALAEAGADVVLIDSCADVGSVPYELATTDDLHETAQLVEKRDRTALTFVADVREYDELDTAVTSAVDQLGRIDIAVANAGIISYHTVADMLLDAWRDVQATNLDGVFHVARTVLPHMISARYGRFIATSSMAGRRGYANIGHYAATKWAVIGLVKVIAIENAAYGITANAVCPGTVGTKLFLNDATYHLFCPDLDAPDEDDVRERLAAAGGPLPWLEPEHVARAVLYLATDTEGLVSGQVMEISMGASAMMT